MKHITFPRVLIVLWIALFLLWASQLVWARPVQTIPNAAAFEASLVCSQFNGLQSFTVQNAATNDEGQQYRITATCNSGHTVTNTIGVK